MSTYNNCLFSGWTPPVEINWRQVAIDRLNKVAELMTDEEYQIWFDDAIKAKMPLTLVDIVAIAEAEAEREEGCTHCNDDMCNCTYRNQEIPY